MYDNDVRQFISQNDARIVIWVISRGDACSRSMHYNYVRWLRPVFSYHQKRCEHFIYSDDEHTFTFNTFIYTRINVGTLNKLWMLFYN